VALLAATSILTHPLLDFMNTYGMRWLMPFVDRWYYADALFIVDPWIWAALTAGMVLARRAGPAGKTGTGSLDARPGSPATASLVVVAGYALLMLIGSQVARRTVARDLAGQGPPPLRVMVSPVPLNPLRRLVVIEEADRYRFGTINWLRRPAFALEPYDIAKNAAHPLAEAARQTSDGQAFLGWARFPFYLVTGSRSDPAIEIVDARYTVDPDAGFGTVTITLPARTGSGEPTPSR
jgi:inner membrane protein